MRKLLILIALLTITTTAFAYNINEIRVCDADGDCLDITASGQIQVTL